MTDSCAECGAAGEWGSCVDLFGALLALDHERRQPWAGHHALNVACYLLQHPSAAAKSDAVELLDLVEAYLRDGLAEVRRRTEAAVARNRRGELPRSLHRGLDDTGGGPMSHTIADVAVDGTFPADGYENRMHAWATAVVTRHKAR